MDIKELEAQITYYASKYYSGEPEITDEQFDSLVDKLRKLNPNSEVLNTGWGFEVIEDKVRHKYSHIGSLDKCKTFADIPDVFKHITIFISPKLDGLSAVAYYKNGKLVKAVTRGNGEIGKDITEKMYKIIGGSISDSKFTGGVRGELIISNENWQKLNLKYDGLISPRNFSAGIINRKDIDEDIQYIDFVTYKVIGQEGENIFKYREEVLRWLSMNFKHCVPEYYYPTLNEPSWEIYHKQTFEDFKNLGYSLDGLVLTKSEIQYNVQTSGYVYTEVAFKFQAESTTTFIKDIEWNLSRTQRLVPVAVIEPVELSGAIVERATCNNAKQVKEWGLGAGAEIEICRSGEVIPLIMNVIQASNDELPKYCPVCNSELVWEGVDLKCGNKHCPNLESSNLEQWCTTIGETDGLQYTIMKQYLDRYEVTNLESLYANEQYILQDLRSRKLSITEEKILEFFHKLYECSVSADKALIALNIPRLGEKTAQILMYYGDVITELYHYALEYQENPIPVSTDLYNKVLNLLKDATTTSIFENLDKVANLKYLMGNNKLGIICYEKPVADNVRYIAVTGALKTMKRKDFENYIKQYGYELSTNLKKCDYLVSNDTESGSSKTQQALKNNVQIINEEDFLKILHKN